MQEKTQRLLNHILPSEDQVRWLNGDNLAFEGKTPQSVIDNGHEDAVIAYLEFYVYGP